MEGIGLHNAHAGRGEESDAQEQRSGVPGIVINRLIPRLKEWS